MQIYSYLICLILLFAFNLISARDVLFDSNEQESEDSRTNEFQRRELFIRKLPSRLTSKRLHNNEQFILNDQERFMPIIRRAKAIVKGDPREFMG